jgi:hypothetical protein
MAPISHADPIPEPDARSHRLLPLLPLLPLLLLLLLPLDHRHHPL